MDRAKEILDFWKDEYPNMACVEAGHVLNPVIFLHRAFEDCQILKNCRNIRLM